MCKSKYQSVSWVYPRIWQETHQSFRWSPYWDLLLTIWRFLGHEAWCKHQWCCIRFCVEHMCI
jgi:hypothetical protein